MFRIGEYITENYNTPKERMVYKVETIGDSQQFMSCYCCHTNKVYSNMGIENYQSYWLQTDDILVPQDPNIKNKIWVSAIVWVQNEDAPMVIFGEFSKCMNRKLQANRRLLLTQFSEIYTFI